MSRRPTAFRRFEDLSPEFLERMAQTLPFSVYVFDLRTRVAEYLNEHLVHALGYADVEDFVSCSLADLMHPDDLARLGEMLARWDSVADGDVLETEYRLRRADGEYRWYLSRDLVFERDAEGSVATLLGSSVDITDRKRLEEGVRQGQKLEAVGRLAGGVAHDFNNVLTAILGHAQLAELAIEDRGAVDKHLAAVISAANQAAAVTGQLLAFAKRQVVRPEPLPLNRAVESSLELLRRLIGDDISLVWEPGALKQSVLIDPGQLTQIVVNLAVNARDAMPGGGRLHIATGWVEVADASLGVEPGRYIALSVEDTGEGMTPQTIERVFEPFFTTKAEGVGTGLGLSTVYGIATQAGGSVRVESDVGVRTRIEVLLPGVEAVETVAEGEVDRLELPRGMRILVVEDSGDIREVVQKSLGHLGNDVVALGDGESACEVIESSDRPFDVLVTDVVLPRRSSKDVVEAFRARWGDASVLFVSGFVPDSAEAHVDRQRFLQKPFTPDQLVQRLARLLLA